MLNEWIEIFVGAYNNIIPDDYEKRDYFISQIIVNAEIGAMIIIGALVLVLGFATVRACWGLGKR